MAMIWLVPLSKPVLTKISDAVYAYKFTTMS